MMKMSDTWVDKIREYNILVYDKVKEIAPELADIRAINQPLNAQTLKLFANMLKEEVDELYEAMSNEDVPEMLKEGSDILFVLIGLYVTFGLPIERAFDRVFDDNVLRVKSGTVRPDGKLVKSPLHPKLRLSDLVA